MTRTSSASHAEHRGGAIGVFRLALPLLALSLLPVAFSRPAIAQSTAPSEQERVADPDQGSLQPVQAPGVAPGPESTIPPEQVRAAELQSERAEEADEAEHPVQAEGRLPAAATSPRARKARYPRIHPEARLQTGAELRKVASAGADEVSDSRQPFFLDQARIGVDVEINPALDATFSAELSDEPAIRDAFINLKVRRYLQLRAGRFKRPSSRTELQGLGRLPFRNRGLASDFLREAGWAGRSLGVMVWGKARNPKLRWSLAVMNANQTIDVSELARIGGADLLGRIEYAPVPWLELAIDGGHKISEAYAGGPNRHLSALAGDVLLRVAGFRLVLEAAAAQNPSPPEPPSQAGRTPFALTFTSYATYDIPIARETALQPTLVVEHVDTDRDLSEDETLRVVLGTNLLLWSSVLRLLPQVELIRPLGKTGARSRAKQTTYYLLLSLQI